MNPPFDAAPRVPRPLPPSKMPRPPPPGERRFDATAAGFDDWIVGAVFGGT